MVPMKCELPRFASLGSPVTRNAEQFRLRIQTRAQSTLADPTSLSLN
jgi:hypothetical protein